MDQFYTNARLAPWLATVARRHSWRLLEQHRREHTKESEDLSQSLYKLIDPNSDVELGRWILIEW